MHRARTSLISVMLSLSFLIAPISHAAMEVNMPRGVTPMSHEIYKLHMLGFWVCVAIAVVVFGILLWAIIFHRKSRGHEAANFHEHTTVEIIWAVIPFLILVVLAIPATRVLFKMEDNTKADINIKVTGYQWKWQYDYVDLGISFFSNLSTPLDQIQQKAKKGEYYLNEVDNPMVVPINKKIRFLITANDVIHSWWVPELGVKKDGIPGFIHESWARIEKVGIYRGQCAELCGMNHGYMPIVVDARTEEDYDKWVAEEVAKRSPVESTKIKAEPKTYTKAELMTQGKSVYERVCAACHKPDGSGMPPAFPALVNSKIVTGPLNGHLDIVVKGKPGTAMQAFGKQLSDDELAAVITYQRNSWGHTTGDVVQPVDIEKFKEANE